MQPRTETSAYPLASTTWGTEEVDAVQEVLKSGQFTMGKYVHAFEKEFAKYIGVKHAVMVNSGSSANLIMLDGLKYRNSPLLKSGDEVIVPSVSWSTTFYPVSQIGLTLRFVDIDPSTLNIDVTQIEKAITDKTRAIFAVNLLGNPCAFEELREICGKYDLLLIEDNCESLGAEFKGEKTGSIGICGSHSFFFSHHMCTMEGGMVTTNDTELYEAMYSLRAHGWIRGLPPKNSVSDLSSDPWVDQFKFVLPGYNFRPLEIEAAAGLVQLKKLPGFISARRENAEYFLSRVNAFPQIRIQEEIGESSWFGFAITLQGSLLGHRKELIQFLSEKGIETRPIVAGNFLNNPVISLLEHSSVDQMESAEIVDKEGFFIGNHHYPLKSELDFFFEAIKNFIDNLEAC